MLQLVVFDQFFKSGCFVDNSLVTKINFELCTPASHCRGVSSGDSTGNNSSLLEIADNQTIFDIEIFDFPARIIICDFTVSQDSINVKKNRFNRGCFPDLVFRISWQCFSGNVKQIFGKLGRKLGKAFYFIALNSPKTDRTEYSS